MIAAYLSEFFAEKGSKCPTLKGPRRSDTTSSLVPFSWKSELHTLSYKETHKHHPNLVSSSQSNHHNKRLTALLLIQWTFLNSNPMYQLILVMLVCTLRDHFTHKFGDRCDDSLLSKTTEWERIHESYVAGLGLMH
jgi:hypothetical protein